MADSNHTATGNTGNEANKTLLIVRHAKSSWDIGTLNDFERPLNDRGKKDAPVMAQRLIDRKIKLEAFVASPAKRAKKTAELFCEIFGRSTDEIIYISKLYHAPSDIFYEVAEELKDSFSKVAVFSHNPGITEFVNSLITDVTIDDMPTCGVFAIEAETPTWKDFKKAKKNFLFFDYPKLA